MLIVRYFALSLITIALVASAAAGQPSADEQLKALNQQYRISIRCATMSNSRLCSPR